jgi:hypothetical protein
MKRTLECGKGRLSEQNLERIQLQGATGVIELDEIDYYLACIWEALPNAASYGRLNPRPER